MKRIKQIIIQIIYIATPFYAACELFFDIRRLWQQAPLVSTGNDIMIILKFLTCAVVIVGSVFFWTYKLFTGKSLFAIPDGLSPKDREKAIAKKMFIIGLIFMVAGWLAIASLLITDNRLPW